MFISGLLFGQFEQHAVSLVRSPVNVLLSKCMLSTTTLIVFADNVVKIRSCCHPFPLFSSSSSPLLGHCRHCHSCPISPLFLLLSSRPLILGSPSLLRYTLSAPISFAFGHDRDCLHIELPRSLGCRCINHHYH